MANVPIPPEVVAALKGGNKIEAIKRLRGMTGLGLKEAKDWIDAYERGAAPALPGEFSVPTKPAEQGFARAHTEAKLPKQLLGPGQVAPDASMGKWVALIAVLGIVVISMAVYYR